MSDPNCSIALTFYQASAYFSQNSFSYHCTQCSSSWEVQQNGSIHPPPRSRVVEISLTGYPDSATFAGFQIAETPEKLPDKIAQPHHIEPGLGVTVHPWPVPTETTILTLDFGKPDLAVFPQGVPRLFYRLAAQVGTNPAVWDDPKIYNDPGQ